MHEQQAVTYSHLTYAEGHVYCANNLRCTADKLAQRETDTRTHKHSHSRIGHMWSLCACFALLDELLPCIMFLESSASYDALEKK